MTQQPKMPGEIWVYDRDGKLEARDCSIVVGNIKYIRADIVDLLVDVVKFYADRSNRQPRLMGFGIMQSKFDEDGGTLAQSALAAYEEGRK